MVHAPLRQLCFLTLLLPVAACNNDRLPIAPKPFTPPPQDTSALTGMIAFNRDRIGMGNTEIYVMKADGSGVTPLFDFGPYNNYNPAWSPDGTQIAFQSTRDGPFFDVFVLHADGSGLTRLTDSRPFLTGSTPAYSGAPAWCGDRIAFYGTRGPTRDDYNKIYVMNADGTGVTRLTFSAASDHSPAWSPTCDRIAFVSNRDGNNEIYVLNADRTGEARVTDNAWGDMDPAWSPDGRRIAFTSQRDGYEEIYTMNPDGSDVVQLTQRPVTNRLPAWSPDGRRIAFTSDRDGNDEIYVMHADGTGVIRLTNDGGSDWRPVWHR